MRDGAKADDGASVPSAPRGPQVLLLCGVGTGNIGNDASLQVTIEQLRSLHPDLKVVVATPFVSGAEGVVDARVIPVRQDLTRHRGRPRVAMVRTIAATEVRRLVDAWRLLRDTDLVLVSGTGIFDDFGEHPWNMPYALLTWTALARVAHTPLAFVAVGAGPVHSRVSRAAFRVAARLADYATYRDHGSMQFMASIGAGRGDARVVPDLVFGLERPQVRPATPAAPSICVGLGVMSYGGWSSLGQGAVYDAYVRCLAAVVERLAVAGHRVTFLVGQPCDNPVVADVVASVPARFRDVLNSPVIRNIPELLDAVGTTDIVIATRYHNIVAALMMSRPVVSMSYAPKNADLLREVGIESFDLPIEDADPEWVLERVERIRSGGSGFGEHTWSIAQGWARQARDEITLAARALTSLSR